MSKINKNENEVKKGTPEPEIREQKEKWDRRDEIIYQSNDLIEFKDFIKSENGSYRIKVYRDKGKIYSYIESYDSDGVEDGYQIEDFPDYVKTAKKIWGLKND